MTERRKRYLEKFKKLPVKQKENRLLAALHWLFTHQDQHQRRQRRARKSQ